MKRVAPFLLFVAALFAAIGVVTFEYYARRVPQPEAPQSLLEQTRVSQPEAPQSLLEQARRGMIRLQPNMRRDQVERVFPIKSMEACSISGGLGQSGMEFRYSFEREYTLVVTYLAGWELISAALYRGSELIEKVGR